MTKHGTILLVDGDTETELRFRKAFDEAGVPHPLQAAVGSDEAVKYLSGAGRFSDRQKYPMPVLILVDMTCPGDDAFALLRWLYDRPGLKKRFIVVVLNSPGAEQDVQLAYELGVQSCLPKPPGYPQLIATVRRVKEYWLELNQPPGTFQ